MKLAGTELAVEVGTDRVQEIICQLVDVIDVERIFFDKGQQHHSFKYCLILITKIEVKQIADQVWPVIHNIMAQYPDFTCKVFTLGYTNAQLQKANLFFLNHCHADKLVYVSDKKDGAWAYPEQDIQGVIEKAKRHFKRDLERIKSFRKGIQFFKDQGHLSESTFMLHQSYELAYRLLEPMVCGSLKVCHSIKNHQAFVLKSLNPIKGMFMVESESESALLDLLDNAYSAARYSASFNVSEKEIVALTEKLGLFIKGVKWHYELQLDQFQVNVLYPSSTDSKIMDTNSNQEKPIPLDELDRIRALAKESLVLLSPIGGKDPGHYLNYVRVYGYAEMFSTLRSMLNVCILALDGQMDLTLDIKDSGTDVKRVLEFAKCIVPFEEGVYLDQMNELMSVDNQLESSNSYR